MLAVLSVELVAVSNPLRYCFQPQPEFLMMVVLAALEFRKEAQLAWFLIICGPACAGAATFTWSFWGRLAVSFEIVSREEFVMLTQEPFYRYGASGVIGATARSSCH